MNREWERRHMEKWREEQRRRWEKAANKTLDALMPLFWIAVALLAVLVIVIRLHLAD